MRTLMACLAAVVVSIGCSGGGSSGGGGDDTPPPAPAQLPIAVDDTATTEPGVAIDIDVLANDVDDAGVGLTVVAFTQAANGAVGLNGNGTLRYTPRGAFRGNDSFTYTVEDGNLETASATVRIEVVTLTQAEPDQATTAEDSAVTIDVTSNDVDGPGTGLTVVAVSLGSSGSVRINADNTVTYSPVRNFFGDDTFTYTIEDNDGERSTGDVAVTVTPVNDPVTLSMLIERAAVSRGGLVEVVVTADDPDDIALIELIADVDGSLATTDDQAPLGSPFFELDGLPDARFVEIDGTLPPSFFVVARAGDGKSAEAVEVSAAPVSFSNVAHAASTGGSDFDAGLDVAVLGDDGYAAAGQFSGRAVFGVGQPGEQIIDALGGTDLYIAAYHGDGSLRWLEIIGGAADESDIAISSAVTAAGETVFACAPFEGTIGFASGTVSLQAIDGTDIFVASYSEAGAFRWARRISGPDLTEAGDRGLGIAAHSDGSVVVAGQLEQTLTFGAGGRRSTTLTSAGRSDIFLARYSRDGDLEWAVRAGGLGEDVALAVDRTTDGGSIVTGSFFAEATFGFDEAAETTLAAAGISDIFLARYDASGRLEWARRAGGAAAESGLDVAVFDDDSCALTGELFGDATFGAGEARARTLSGIEGPDGFIARYDADGSLFWVQRAGGADNGRGDRGRAITALPDGSAIVVGAFESEIVFEGDGEDPVRLTGSGASEVFIARIDSGGALRWARKATGADLGVDGDAAVGVASFRDGSCVITGVFDDALTLGAGDVNETTLSSGPAPDAFHGYYNADGGF